MLNNDTNHARLTFSVGRQEGTAELAVGDLLMRTSNSSWPRLERCFGVMAMLHKMAAKVLQFFSFFRVISRQMERTGGNSGL